MSGNHVQHASLFVFLNIAFEPFFIKIYAILPVVIKDQLEFCLTIRCVVYEQPAPLIN